MNEYSFCLPAYAKINRFLKIIGKRPDNFHEICTSFQTVSLHDNLFFVESDEISLTCDNPVIPTDENNLIIRAAQILKNEFDVKQGARIHLEKNIPSPGGLGGGSSNAAVALLGLAGLWKLKINLETLCRIGALLGSDVPFFFYGGTALAAGRGTDIFPAEDIKDEFILIVIPAVEISTAQAYDLLNSPRLTNSSSKRILKICRQQAERQYLRQSNPENDFEKVIFKIESEIGRVKKRLLETGAKSALLSGSGASVFGIFENNETRQASLVALENEHNWRKFAVATVSRASYRENLKVVSE
ncbi:MAG: 4-(cytidine 5'-diphospho)-2-C-methyl-D-erythritol kinase [Pyrinomonadaceae bacterium]